MRGERQGQRAMLVVIDPDKRVAKDHPLRRIKQLAEQALAQVSPVFDQMYSAVGGPSIPRERLLNASLLMALYTVRSEGCFASSSIKLYRKWGCAYSDYLRTQHRVSQG